MYSIKVGQIIYNYHNKYELYYKITKNFHLKYKDYFKNLRSNKKDTNTITIKLINGIEFYFQASEDRTEEWKSLIKNIQSSESSKQIKYESYVNPTSKKIKFCPIEEAYKRKKKKSSYRRLFKEKNVVADHIADLATSIHSTTISEGVKLEQHIFDEFEGEKYKNIKFKEVEKIIKNNKSNKTILFKKVIIPREIINQNTNHKHKRSKNIHLDLLILHKEQIYIDELKDGDSLDTQKSDTAIQEIKAIKELFENIVGLTCVSSIVLWTCQNIETSSIKTIGADDYILRGRDLCDTLNISYDFIEYKRNNSYEGNLDFVVDKMVKIVDLYKSEKK